MNLNEQQTKRLGEIYQELMESYVDKIKSLENISKSLEQRMTIFQPKLINRLKTKCAEQFDYLQKLGKPSANGDISLDVPSDKEEEAKEKISQWEKCSMENDLGVKSYFTEVEESSRRIHESNEKCLETCVTDLDKKSNSEIITCFKPCFNVFFQQNELSMKNVVSKIEEIEKLI